MPRDQQNELLKSRKKSVLYSLDPVTAVLHLNKKTMAYNTLLFHVCMLINCIPSKCRINKH